MPEGGMSGAAIAAAGAAEPARRMTDAEAALINLAAALLVMPISDPEEVALYLDRIGAVLPFVPRDRLMVRDLAVACEDLVATAGQRHKPHEVERAPWHRARHDARTAVELVLRWRAGQALARVTELQRQVEAAP